MIFIGSLKEGKKYPRRMNDSPVLDLRGWKDIILVDKEYFLENRDRIEYLIVQNISQ